MRRLEVRLSGALVREFADEAGKRELTPSQLLRQLIEVILRDNLIDAILDDGQEHENQHRTAS